MPRDSSAGPLGRGQPSQPAPRPSGQLPAGAATAIVAACLLCLPLTQISEGRRLRPYRDPAHIVTWCYGETRGKPKDRYSAAECAQLLQGRLARDYAPEVAKCLPELAEPRRIKIFAAFLDAAYNAGPAPVCSSRMARSVHAGDLAGACSGFFGWYATARDRRTGQRIQLRGLQVRRQREAALCRDGLAAAGIPPSEIN